MSMTVTTTINETSFAVAFMDATALVLDAVALTGERRRDALTRADARLDAAYRYHGTPEELILAQGLTATIKQYEREGRAW